MSTSTPPSLTIITGRAGRRVQLASSKGDRIQVRIAEPSVVREQYHSLARNLQRFRNAFDDVVEADIGTAAAQLDQLAGAGRNFLAAVMDGDFGDLERLAEFVAAACPTWQTGLPVPVVHVVGQLEHHLPWELLPLFHWRVRAAATTRAELLESARAFIGYGALVERQLPQPVPINPVLDTNGYLQIRILYDASYLGAQDEVHFLKGRAPRVMVEGPYPGDGDSDGEPTVGQQLRDPTIGVDGSRRDKPDQVVHFGCHCETDSKHGWEEYLFRFAAKPSGPSRTLSLGALMNDLMLAEDWNHPERSQLMPLVFLNACGTSVIDPKRAMSMLTPFAKNGNRGLIATAARIPDRVAAKFSRWFYTELFRGRTVAEAVHLARRDLLVTYANPLGLLYAYYGHPDLRALPVIDSIRP